MWLNNLLLLLVSRLVSVHVPHPENADLALVVLDEGVVMQLMSMGFDLEGCKKAVYHTQNQGVEPAMNWVLEHMGDPGTCLGRGQGRSLL